MPIKTLPFAVLFFAGAVAATTFLASPVLDDPISRDAEAPAAEMRQLTHRGTRRPLVTETTVDDRVASQPRRGERTAFETAAVASVGEVGEVPRRGMR